MTEFARVSLPGGHATVPVITAAAMRWRVLNRPAVDANGRPLPPKPRVHLTPERP